MERKRRRRKEEEEEEEEKLSSTCRLTFCPGFAGDNQVYCHYHHHDDSTQSRQ